jgi:polar amino acid transport system substrate-binding protein
MARPIRFFFLALICFCLILARAEAKDLKASLPLIPPLVESKDKGVIVDLVKAMADEYKGGKITWDVFPFARSMDNVEKGRADFHMPQLVNPNISLDKLPFQFSSEKIFRVVFVLYTNKNNPKITPANVSSYKVESEMGTKDFFGFPVTGSPDVASSLKKVDIGRLDGFIFAMPETDLVLKKLALKNIKRAEYKKFDVRIVLPKGPQGKETDAILTDIIKKLKADGRYQKIMAPILDQKFENWQL